MLGERLPGAISGEVPITLGTPFPSGFRAAAASRIMRVEAQDYHAVAAAAPDVAVNVGTLARERVGGLQGIAAEPPQPRAVVVGHRWDATCSEVRRFLDRNQITFEWLTPDAAEAAERWTGALPPDGDCPVVRVMDGTKLVRPRLREVAELLGLQTRPSAGEYDTIIIGAGPAGLAAAVYGASEGLRTIVIERPIGKGIFYGAARSEAASTHGLDVHIIGAGNSAGQASLFFANHARSVTIVCRGDTLEKSMSQYLVDQVRGKSNIAVELGAEVVAVHGEASLSAIDIRERATGKISRHECGSLFIFIGADAETGWLPPEIALDARGYVLTGADVQASGRWTHDRDPYLLETSVSGIFACGDVRFGPVKRVASAVGEGSMAIAFVHQHLRDT